MFQKKQSFWQRWTPTDVLLIGLFAIAPLYYHPNLGGEGLRIPNNATVWLFAVVFVIYSLNKVITSTTFQLPRYFVFIVSFPALVILSGFLAGVEQPLRWLFRVLYIVGGLAFFFSLYQHKFKQGRWDRLLLLIALTGLLHSGMGVIQILWNTHIPYLLPLSTNGLASGFFQQINNQASYLATIISLAFYLASRPILLRRCLFLQAGLIIVVAVSGFIIASSGSRIGMLGLILAVPLIILTRQKQLMHNKLFAGLLIIAVTLGVSGGFKWSAGKVLDKTVALHSGYTGSARLGIYDISLDLLAEQPIYGQGIGSFSRVFQAQRPQFYEKHPSGILPAEFVSHPHNELLFWLVEGGAVAVVGIVLVLTGVLLALRRTGTTRAWAYFGLLLPISLHTQVELPFYISALHWFMLLLLMAMPFFSLAVTRVNRMTKYARSVCSVSALVSTLVVFIFLAHTIRSNWDIVAFYKGQSLDNQLTIAKNNPYLASEAQWIEMNAILYSSMQYDIPENVVSYAKWASVLLEKRPDVDIFIKLVDAYEFLNNRTLYCEVATKGVAMYPMAESLKAAVQHCN